MLYCIAVVYGFGYGVLYPVTNALAIKHAPPENRGAANATYTCAFDLASLLGGLFCGGVSSGIGYANMYLCSGAFLFLDIPLNFVY